MGITVEGSGARITDCIVTGSASHGILVEADARDVQVDLCDLVDNGGSGLANLSGSTVDAPNNWWGDPAGPDGPSGDGTSGAVATDPVRTQPIHPPSAGAVR